MSVGEFIRGRASPRLAQRLADDRSGNVAIVFALTLMVLVQAAGGAVDYGRCLNARSQMQTALDAAVLAAGRVLQTSGGDQSAALRAARQYYDQLRSRLSASDGASFAVTGGGTAVEGVSSATIPTPFLHAMGIADLLVSASAKAVLEAGGNAGTSLEIALMLDITGSMAGQKIADLKLAAMDLINTVVWADQGTYSSRVAIAPFAARVSAAGYGTAVTGLPAAQTFFGQPRKLIQCVTERTGADALTDEAPENGRYVSAYMGDAGAAAAANPGNYSSSGVCYDPSASATVMPLTSDRAALKAHVDGLRAGGSTAGQLGTAWAWYLLSPKWSSIWPTASRPGAYSELTTVGPDGRPRLQKIAVLMTDGAYNTQHGAAYGDPSSAAVRISESAVKICRAMKDAGVVVYTVAFQIGGNSLATNTMENCASSPEHFYNSWTGDQLRQAFRDIALKVATLRIAG